MTRTKLVVLAFVAILIGTSATVGLHDEAKFTAQRQSLPIRGQAGESTGESRVQPFLDFEEAAAIQQEVDDYLEGVERERKEREAAEEAERVASARRAANVAVARPGVGGTVGDCTGFAVPDYIIQRESGGNPSAYNASSGAYGCTQTLLSHYYGGICSGLDPYTIEGQRACTQILVDRAGLSPWAQTR